jgi:hypothetical protein
MSVIGWTEFHGLDAIENAATKAALDRCRMLADRIVNELDSKAELFRDLAAFAEFLASLEGAADAVKQKGHRKRRLKQDVSKKRLSGELIAPQPRWTSEQRN